MPHLGSAEESRVRVRLRLVRVNTEVVAGSSWIGSERLAGVRRPIASLLSFASDRNERISLTLMPAPPRIKGQRPLSRVRPSFFNREVRARTAP
jgi:hypothetical protein